jgi:tRNA-2-methylthio-N6-dimethylallyladenosine synthase
VIVGFSGETDEDFAQTLDLVSEVGFRGLFGFKYSRRPYTPALKLDDDVPEAIKGERLSALFALAEVLQGAHLRSLVGSRQRVLLEGPSKTGSESATGRTERNEIVHVAEAAALSLVGELVEVRITAANKHSLEAELADRASSAASATPEPRPRERTPRSLPLLMG